MYTQIYLHTLKLKEKGRESKKGKSKERKERGERRSTKKKKGRGRKERTRRRKPLKLQKAFNQPNTPQ